MYGTKNPSTTTPTFTTRSHIQGKFMFVLNLDRIFSTVSILDEHSFESFDSFAVTKTTVPFFKVTQCIHG